MDTDTRTAPDVDVSARASAGQLEHKHGLDEWAPMMPERSGQTVVVGESAADDVFRCQRVGCTEVVRLRSGSGAG